MPAPTGYCRWCGLDHSEIVERHDAQQARWRREARQAETEGAVPGCRLRLGADHQRMTERRAQARERLGSSYPDRQAGDRHPGPLSGQYRLRS